MLALVALAAVVSAPQVQPVSIGPTVQARATVRIVSGVRLKLDGTANADAPAPRDAIVRTADLVQPARLIEFQ
ncbi:MAG: hypothetical protein V4513_05790 [Pseudomonadota bacterium]